VFKSNVIKIRSFPPPGRFPFQGNTDAKIMGAIMQDRAAVPDGLGISDEAKDFISKVRRLNTFKAFCS
jgi:hypothetical protein